MRYISMDKNRMIAELVLRNEPANTLCAEVLMELDEALNQIKVDREIRVILLRGEGRFFSAGADVKEFKKNLRKTAGSRLAEKGQKLMEKIETFPKPIIAAVHGAALGGGLELAMSCHIRYVTEHAKLGLPELQLGLVPGFGGSQRLVRYIGMAKAAELMLTSESVSGRAAVELGIANAFFAEEELFPAARLLAEKISNKSPASVKAILELLQYTKHDQYFEGIKKEAILFESVFNTADAKEGIAAFIEKRTPHFKGC